jgi:hypothetical protein
MRILLVDDDAGFRALLRTTFEAVDVAFRDVEPRLRPVHEEFRGA